MTRKEYEAEIVALKKRIAELGTAQIEEESPAPPHPRCKPKQGYYYYCVEPSTDSLISFYYNGGDRTTLFEKEFDIGNVFCTRADAEFAAERLKVLAEMQEWAGSWYDEFSLRYEKNSGVEIYLHLFPRKTYGEMRFATKEDAENCIKAVGEDRIKKYYFRVSEETENETHD